MALLLILLALAAVLSIVSIRAAIRDERGPVPPPTSRFQDPLFRPPAERVTDQVRGG